MGTAENGLETFVLAGATTGFSTAFVAFDLLLRLLLLSLSSSLKPELKGSFLRLAWTRSPLKLGLMSGVLAAIQAHVYVTGSRRGAGAGCETQSSGERRYSGDNGQAQRGDEETVVEDEEDEDRVAI